jgi:uncharacterized SAM-binding protein YcdF (DUF218 family)
MSRRRRAVFGLLLCLIALSILWAAHPICFRAMARWLDVGERPHAADYVMLLNGGENTRPFVAAALVKAGWARKILVADVAPSSTMLDGILPAYHEINRRVMIQRGVPEDDILILPGKGVSTFDEAESLSIFLKDRPSAKVLVVTDDFHTRRSRWAFARALGDRAGQTSFISAKTEDFFMDAWWKDERGVAIILSEYLKMAYYVARYGYVAHWLAACLLFVGVSVWIHRKKLDSLVSFA